MTTDERIEAQLDKYTYTTYTTTYGCIAAVCDGFPETDSDYGITSIAKMEQDAIDGLKQNIRLRLRDLTERGEPFPEPTRAS